MLYIPTSKEKDLSPNNKFCNSDINEIFSKIVKILLSYNNSNIISQSTHLVTMVLSACKYKLKTFNFYWTGSKK